MVYLMKFEVDGGCRRNGQPDSFGAAAAVLLSKYGKHKVQYRRLPSTNYGWGIQPTNQRAEITALILAFERAIDKYDNLHHSPRLRLEIHTDSTYLIGCMTDWGEKWRSNGWVSARGTDVANRDLLEEAYELESRLEDFGNIKYQWIPREENYLADQWCNKIMDEM